jgi:UDP-hydrolysing UDP-N-acetyl-D-glucosamine 2-epimerase
MKKKICVFISNRANYSSIKSVMLEIKKNPKLELQLILGSSAILDRFGSVKNDIIKDGFKPDFLINILVEGSSPSTMAKSTGLAMIELSSIFSKIRPDVALTVGDRFENMAFALTAAYMNIIVAHTMGGETSGTIDESIRHAITKFAHLHFPATKDAANRIIKMGEDPKRVFLVGCPRVDLVKQILRKPSKKILKNLFHKDGVGQPFDINQPFLLISQHPVTTEFGLGEKQIMTTLNAISKINLPAIILWPNPDAGSDDISRGIRKWREKDLAKNMYFFKNLNVEKYIHLMNKTVCLVGNSSSGIREGAFIGTPVVNIGTRQDTRMCGSNVIHSEYNVDKILAAIKKQISLKKYNRQNIYGNGTASKKIISQILKNINHISVQKNITY